MRTGTTQFVYVVYILINPHRIQKQMIFNESSGQNTIYMFQISTSIRHHLYGSGILIKKIVTDLQFGIRFFTRKKRENELNQYNITYLIAMINLIQILIRICISLYSINSFLVTVIILVFVPSGFRHS